MRRGLPLATRTATHRTTLPFSNAGPPNTLALFLLVWSHRKQWAYMLPDLNRLVSLDLYLPSRMTFWPLKLSLHPRHYMCEITMAARPSENKPVGSFGAVLPSRSDHHRMSGEECNV